VLKSGYEPVAQQLLRIYSGTDGRDAPYTGASFQVLAGRGDSDECRDAITAGDIVAVSTLSVDVPAHASISLLGSDAGCVTSLLRDIPVGLDLVDAEETDIAPTSAAGRLWTFLREDVRIGRTTTSKLMARKRPQLIPIYDSVVALELGLKGSKGHWAWMREVLLADGGALNRRAVGLQDTPGAGPLVSPLRVFDVVVWMHGQDHARSLEIASDKDLPLPPKS